MLYPPELGQPGLPGGFGIFSLLLSNISSSEALESRSIDTELSSLSMVSEGLTVWDVLLSPTHTSAKSMWGVIIAGARREWDKEENSIRGVIIGRCGFSFKSILVNCESSASQIKFRS